MPFERTRVQRRTVLAMDVAIASWLLVRVLLWVGAWARGSEKDETRTKTGASRYSRKGFTRDPLPGYLRR